MARAKLDRIDRRILSDLQSNGRMTNVELAERAGISAPPCLRRVRALERAGIIKGYHADLSPEALGYSVSVFALVGLSSQAETDLKAFEELIAKWDEVRECHMLAGEADFLLQVVVPDLPAYERFLLGTLLKLPGVSDIRSNFAIATVKALGSGENGYYMTALTFGNVHGVYKPGNVKLKPEVLAEGQKVAAAKLGLAEGSKPFDFVFHGGSGSLKSEIEDSLRYGVVKMNVDTDTQYAFTRPVAAHMFTNYDGVLKIDGEVGNKKVYDPRSYLKKAEASMTQRVIEACNDLHSTGRSVSAGLSS